MLLIKIKPLSKINFNNFFMNILLKMDKLMMKIKPHYRPLTKHIHFPFPKLGIIQQK